MNQTLTDQIRKYFIHFTAMADGFNKNHSTLNFINNAIRFNLVRPITAQFIFQGFAPMRVFPQLVDCRTYFEFLFWM